MSPIHTSGEADIPSIEEQAALCFDKIYKLSWKAMRDYRLLAQGDRILIGVSGGKDSLALTEVMGRRQINRKPAFSVVAAHIAMDGDPYCIDRKYVEEHCQNQGVPFYYRSIPSPWAVQNHTQARTPHQTTTDKSPCFMCSWSRRKTLFQMASELGCNKIALGHNLDDVLQTFLMNQVFQGSLSTIPPVLEMNKFPMTLIRPLYLVEESSLQKYADLRGYKPVAHSCRYEDASHRHSMKKLLEQFRELNPRVVHSMLKALHNVMPEYLPNKIGYFK